MFAQDQVSELPPPAVPVPLDAPVEAIVGDSHGDRLTALEALAAELGYRMIVTNTGPAEGKCYRQLKLIELSDQLQPNGRLAAGIHELGHALVGLDDLALKLSYAEEELIVESVAYCVCQTLGLATDANSIPYLASWAEAADLAVLERAAALTARLADRIEASLISTPQEAEPAVAAGQRE